MSLVIRTVLVGFVASGISLVCGKAHAGPRVDVVVAKDAPDLERFAARELRDQFRQLFDADVQISDVPPAKPRNLILIGSPTTNPAVRSVVKDWPGQMTDQGQLIRSVMEQGQTTLVVGGQSPEGTLWSVYELGHHFGIRSALFGDMYPANPPELKLDGIDIWIEPELKIRGWRLIGDSPIGSESWGLAEHERLIKQLAKLKFNVIVVATETWQPFVHFESQAIKKQTGILFRGHRFPVDGDTAGRAAFKGAKFFENPDFAGTATYADRSAAGVKFANGILQASRKLGMKTILSMSPHEFPPEFAKLVTDSKPEATLVVSPDSPTRAASESVKLLARDQLLASLKAYPDIDALAFRPHGKQIPTEFFIQYVADKNLYKLPNGESPKVILSGGELDLYQAIINSKLESAVLLFEGESPKTLATDRPRREKIGTTLVPSVMNLTLSGDTAGLLPRMSQSSLKVLVDDLRKSKWEGFIAQAGTIGDLDHSAYYLSRASFDETTPEESLDHLVTASLGEGTLDRTLKAFNLIEQASNLIDQHDPDFAMPTKDIFLKHYSSSEPVPEWWGQVKGHYLAAMDEMYRVNTRAREGNRIYSLYLARRFEFGAEYMSCLESVRRAGIAKAKGNKETQVAELEKAVESLDAALNALAAVARGSSDRGVIAVLNEFGYRPLMKQLEAE